MQLKQKVLNFIEVAQYKKNIGYSIVYNKQETADARRFSSDF